VEKGELAEEMVKEFLSKKEIPFIWHEYDAFESILAEVYRIPSEVQLLVSKDLVAVAQERKKVYTKDFRRQGKCPWGFGFDALAALDGIWGWLEVKSGRSNLTRGQRIHRRIANELGIPLHIARVNLENGMVSLESKSAFASGTACMRDQ
jgi:hypothetical protein